MTLKYTEHETIRLKNHASFNETWLQGIIADNPSVLGLGELTFIEKERRQESGGRLDLLLSDENDTRYEVELQLGATDERHIIRCIEYWDVERRRYPGYDHVAVLVAEDVTSRFLNVLGLFSGTIPLVVLQLNALQVKEMLVLDFVKVLDQRELRSDDVAEVAPPADRDYWKKKKGDTALQIVDELAALVKEQAEQEYEVQYNKHYIAVRSPGSFFNLLTLIPRRAFVHVRFRVEDPKPILERLEEAGLEARIRRKNRVTVTLRPGDVVAHSELLGELVHQAVHEAQR
ncbi:hypothetical protein ACFL51_00340 [Myxococcota bacterium]